jgi:hypothetical protein
METEGLGAGVGQHLEQLRGSTTRRPEWGLLRCPWVACCQAQSSHRITQTPVGSPQEVIVKVETPGTTHLEGDARAGAVVLAEEIPRAIGSLKPDSRSVSTSDSSIRNQEISVQRPASTDQDFLPLTTSLNVSRACQA